MTPNSFNAELWPIERVKPYAKNAKKHTPEQVETLAGLIQNFGWTQPIVVDRKGVIIIGHGRTLAAKKLGLTKVPVLQRSDLTDAQADAIRLADNRIVSDLYDIDLMQEELARLKLEDIDVDGLGFTDEELRFLTENIEVMDEGVFADDITLEVEKKTKENAETIENMDERDVTMSKAFGFTKLSVAQSRRVKSFMGRIETETRKKGVDALMCFFDEFGI